MSKGLNGDVASGLSRSVMKLTEMAVRAATSNAGDGAAMAIGATAGPLFMASGLLSKGFSESGNTPMHPATYANRDNVLFICLLMARALNVTNDGTSGGVALELSPSIYLDAMDDFKKLSAVPVDQVIRADVIKGVAEATAPAGEAVEALLARLQAPSADKLH